jgi:hypothetical protein
MMKKKHFILFIIISFLFFSCSYNYSIIRKVKKDPDAWHPLFKGIDYQFITTAEPRPLRVHTIRIDLTEPTVQFFVTPSNGPDSLDTEGRKVSQFLKETGCQVAINASPFSPVLILRKGNQDVTGLSISEGDIYSQAEHDFGVLLINKENRIQITEPPFTLYNVIDGRQEGYSEGVSTYELAQWMLFIGAYDALNLDGGGSSTLAIEGKNGKPVVLNSPIHLGMPGCERIVANHLGIFAESLE